MCGLAAPRATVPQSVKPTYVHGTWSRGGGGRNRTIKSWPRLRGYPSRGCAFGWWLTALGECDSRSRKTKVSVVSAVLCQRRAGRHSRAVDRRDERLIARVPRQREQASERKREGERCRKPLTDRATRRPTNSSSWVGAVSENRRSRYNSSK